MKKYLLLSGFLPFLTFTFSQENTGKKTEIVKLQHVQKVTGGTKKTAGTAPVEPDSVILARLDYQIKAIRHKMEYVKSDPVMFEKATKDGWFEQMEKHIAGAEAKKKKITQ